MTVNPATTGFTEFHRGQIMWFCYRHCQIVTTSSGSQAQIPSATSAARSQDSEENHLGSGTCCLTGPCWVSVWQSLELAGHLPSEESQKETDDSVETNWGQFDDRETAFPDGHVNRPVAAVTHYTAVHFKQSLPTWPLEQETWNMWKQRADWCKKTRIANLEKTGAPEPVTFISA